MTRLEQADQFMSDAHRSIGQMRRYGGRRYEVHPRRVRDILAAGGASEDVLIAALFHDIVEDVTPTNPEYDLARIEREFGAVVAGYVQELTDVYTKAAWPALNRAERKERECARYARMSSGARLVKLADIADNLSDLQHADPGFALMFLRESAKSLSRLQPRPRDDDRLRPAIEKLHHLATEQLRAQSLAFGAD